MRILILLLICVSVQTSWGETNEELSLTLNKIQDDIKGLALETSLQLPEESEPQPSPDEPANGCMTVDAVCVPMQNCTGGALVIAEESNTQNECTKKPSHVCCVEDSRLKRSFFGPPPPRFGGPHLGPGYGPRHGHPLRTHRYGHLPHRPRYGHKRRRLGRLRRPRRRHRRGRYGHPRHFPHGRLYPRLGGPHYGLHDPFAFGLFSHAPFPHHPSYGLHDPYAPFPHHPHFGPTPYGYESNGYHGTSYGGFPGIGYGRSEAPTEERGDGGGYGRVYNSNVEDGGGYGGSYRPNVEDGGSYKPNVEDGGSYKPNVEDGGSYKTNVEDGGSYKPNVEDGGSYKPNVEDEPDETSQGEGHSSPDEYADLKEFVKSVYTRSLPTENDIRREGHAEPRVIMIQAGLSLEEAILACESTGMRLACLSKRSKQNQAKSYLKKGGTAWIAGNEEDECEAFLRSPKHYHCVAAVTETNSSKQELVMVDSPCSQRLAALCE